MSDVTSSEVSTREPVTNAVAGFRTELNAIFNRAGGPSPKELSRRSHRPPTMFAFLQTDGLPSWQEVSSLLVALKQPNHVVEKLRAAHTKLERRLAREGVHAALAAARDAVPGSLVVNTDREFRALAEAQAAQSMGDFAAALERLRSTARLPDKDTPISYVDMQKISGARLSKSAAQRLSKLSKLPSNTAKTAAHVQEYVRACGTTEEHVQAWLTEYRRIKNGEPPAVGDHATPVNTGPTQNRDSPDGFLAGLTDTDAFTTPKLGLDGRKLILFVSAAIVDDTGSTETTYRSILRRWGNARDHWSFGMTLDQLQEHLARYVGRTARKVPLWPMICDLLEAAVRDPGARETVIADAAGLYQQVTGDPPPEYFGTTHLPWWGYPRTGRTQLDTVLTSLPKAGSKLTEAELELIELREDKYRLRQALDTTLRAFRVLQARETAVAARERRLADWEAALRRRELAAATANPQPMRTVAELPGPSMWSLIQASG